MAVSTLSGLRGKTEPRLQTPPLRDLTPETSLGFEAIEFAETILGFDLLPWQKHLLIHGLELNLDGTYRFRTVLVLVSRQNGKTTLLSVLALWRMFLDGGRMVLGTSTNLSMAEDAWLKSVDLAESTPELNDSVEAIVRGSGNKQMVLKTGERYRVAASNRRGGRGLSVDLALLDELREHTTYEAWSSVSKTTLARPRAQAWCFSNAGDARSIVLRDLRDKALDAPDDSDLGIFEWSAPEDADIEDRNAWAQANPSLGYTITESALASALSTDPEHVFRTEALCQWVDAMRDPVFGRGAWEACIDPESKIVSHLAYGVAVSYDRTWSCIGVAGRNAEGKTHVEVIEYRRGTDWVTARVAELATNHNADTVVIDGRGPASSLISQLRDAGVDLTVASTSDVTDAAAGLYDTVRDGRVAHLDDDDLDNAVAGAQKRDVVDRWAWGRKQSINDISPLEAVTLAAWAVAQINERSALETLYF